MQVKWKECMKLIDGTYINIITQTNQILVVVKKGNKTLYDGTFNMDYVFGGVNTAFSKTMDMVYANILSVLGVKHHKVIKRFWMIQPMTLKSDILVLVSKLVDEGYEMYITKDGIMEYFRYRNLNDVKSKLNEVTKGL